jgi:hypothetical protein
LGFGGGGLHRLLNFYLNYDSTIVELKVKFPTPQGMDVFQVSSLTIVVITFPWHLDVKVGCQVGFNFK